jgi:hypothetical protein
VIAVHGALADQDERQGGRQAGLVVAQRGALGLQQPARLVRVVGPQRLQLAEHHGHRNPLGGRLGREHGEHPAQNAACLGRAPAAISASPWALSSPTRRSSCSCGSGQ